jgi:hypothetical protein
MGHRKTVFSDCVDGHAGEMQSSCRFYSEAPSALTLSVVDCGSPASELHQDFADKLKRANPIFSDPECC